MDIYYATWMPSILVSFKSVILIHHNMLCSHGPQDRVAWGSKNWIDLLERYLCGRKRIFKLYHSRIPQFLPSNPTITNESLVAKQFPPAKWYPHFFNLSKYKFPLNYDVHIEGILPKGPYPPCLRMADRAFLAGYPGYVSDVAIQELRRYTHICILYKFR